MVNSQKASETEINGVKFTKNIQSAKIEKHVKINSLIKSFINITIIESKNFSILKLNQT